MSSNLTTEHLTDLEREHLLAMWRRQADRSRANLNDPDGNPYLLMGITPEELLEHVDRDGACQHTGQLGTDHRAEWRAMWRENPKLAPRGWFVDQGPRATTTIALAAELATPKECECDTPGAVDHYGRCRKCGGVATW